ncbi:MAG: LysR family transcriptional regulator [Proteobacteria bacterium]|nr:MAG: LysR family transcriptional regulator [Pseudomonadota bacterium]
MDLIENIRIFKRVAEKGSFSGVAIEMRTSQPSISRAVMALEQQLGISLIRRTTRGLSLTAEGQKLIAMGGSLLEQVDFLLASIKNEKHQFQGQLRIACSLITSRIIIVPLLKKFSELHPNVRLSFHVSDGYMDLIENGIDLAIRIGELKDSSLKAIKLGSFQRCLYASKDYIARNGRPKTIEQLRDHRLIYYIRGAERPHWMMKTKTGGESPFYFEPYLQSDGADLMREAVLAGLGIALIPSFVMIGPEADKSVVRLFEKSCLGDLPINILSARTQQMTAMQKAFADILAEQFTKIAGITPIGR